MGFITKFKDYFNDDVYRISFVNGIINVINYNEIKEFSNSRIVILYNNGSSIIRGDNLVINKMYDDEVLITGNIKSIDL